MLRRKSLGPGDRQSSKMMLKIQPIKEKNYKPKVFALPMTLSREGRDKLQRRRKYLQITSLIKDFYP